MWAKNWRRYAQHPLDPVQERYIYPPNEGLRCQHESTVVNKRSSGLAAYAQSLSTMNQARFRDDKSIISIDKVSRSYKYYRPKALITSINVLLNDVTIPYYIITFIHIIASELNNQEYIEILSGS
ncbi:hypothetical protein V1477_007879 [Vespula maculifrons]|uniref:Uncharacterized protein n=1 Tax=Vespula maculifrons TaxID=7453 RepID=A0ABD2CIF3_VESMC